MATRQVLADLVAGFAQQSGTQAAIESVGGVDAAKRVAAGEAFDVVILASDAIDKLMAAGHLVHGSKVDWVHSGVAVAVPLATTFVSFSSSATVQRTSTFSAGMPPPSSGFGARRVQITNPSGDGSPLATPSANG